jgi:hypothetical protein
VTGHGHEIENGGKGAVGGAPHNRVRGDGPDYPRAFPAGDLRRIEIVQ